VSLIVLVDLKGPTLYQRRYLRKKFKTYFVFNSFILYTHIKYLLHARFYDPQDRPQLSGNVQNIRTILPFKHDFFK
jgi:hypothetical protein